MDTLITAIKTVINVNMQLAANGFAKEAESNLTHLHNGLPDSEMVFVALLLVLLRQKKRELANRYILEKRRGIEQETGIVDVIVAANELLFSDADKGIEQIQNIINSSKNEDVKNIALTLYERCI